MSKLLEWIKANVKDGANVAEAEEMIEKDSISFIKTKDQALKVIAENAAFVSAKDSLISTATAAHDKNFMADKLPELEKAMREKLQKELNPEMTPEQKELAEIRAKLAERDKSDSRTKLEKELLKGATGIYGNTAFDPERITAYSVYGENALSMLKADFESNTAFIKSQVDELTKNSFSKKTPEGGENNPNVKTISRAAFDALLPTEKRVFLKDGGQPVDE